MSQIKTYISGTLQPSMSSYGLVPTTLTATFSDGDIVTIPITNSPAPISSTQSPSAEVATAHTLYLLDRFAVSDEFYHELAQVFTLTVCNSAHNFNKCLYEYRFTLIFPDIPRVHHKSADNHLTVILRYSVFQNHMWGSIWL